MDIKQQLRQVIVIGSREPFSLQWYELKDLCQSALAEIERLEGLNDQCVDLVRVSCPGIGAMTRHTITLQEPLPALNPGDSLLLQVVLKR
jgi:hypothetical protein